MPKRTSKPGLGRRPAAPQTSASPEPTPRAAESRHAASRTAEQAPGQGSTTMPSSDWLAERERPPQDPGASKAGVPIGTGKESVAARGKALESRRGAHKSG